MRTRRSRPRSPTWGAKYTTKYLGVHYGVEAAYQKQAIDENIQEVEAIAADNGVTMERAKAVLDEG